MTFAGSSPAAPATQSGLRGSNSGGAEWSKGATQIRRLLHAGTCPDGRGSSAPATAQPVSPMTPTSIALATSILSAARFAPRRWPANHDCLDEVAVAPTRALQTAVASEN